MSMHGGNFVVETMIYAKQHQGSERPLLRRLLKTLFGSEMFSVDVSLLCVACSGLPQCAISDDHIIRELRISGKAAHWPQ